MAHRPDQLAARTDRIAAEIEQLATDVGTLPFSVPLPSTIREAAMKLADVADALRDWENF